MLVKLGWQNEYVFTCSSVLQSAGCQVPGCASPPAPPTPVLLLSHQNLVLI